MRPLSPALADAVRAGAFAPWVRLQLLDATPHYAPLYSGGPSGRNAAVAAADGTIAQAYHDGVHTVYARRVPDPTATDWGPWAAVTASAAPGAAVALARLDDRLRLLWQDVATTAVYAADSFDNGAGWAAPETLFDAGAPLAALAADGTTGTVFVVHAAGGAWRAAVWTQAGATWYGADWPNGDRALVAGLAAVRRDDGSYLLALAAGTGSSLGIETCTYAGAWSAAQTVVPAAADASVRLAEPRLARYDARYHLSYSVVDAGASSPLAPPHVALLHSSDGIHWTDPLEDAASYAYGATPLCTGAGYLLVAPDAAALAPPYMETPARYADLSAVVSRLEVIQKDGLPARLVVTIQSTARTVAPPLRLNAVLRLSLGGAGGIVPAYLFYVGDWSAVRAADEDETVITASDRSAWLDRQSRTTLLYTNQTVEWLAREIAARAELLDVDIPAAGAPGAEQFAYTVSTFSIPAGTTWRAALLRLGRLYGFDAAMRVRADGTDVFALYVKSPADASVWTYGHDVEHLVVARDLDRANHVIVFGAGDVVGEAWDWDDVAETGQERYLHEIETLITTGEGASLRAALELQREMRLGRSGALSAPLHPGLELGDVIAVGDGATAASLRIVALHDIYEPHSGVYDTVLTCEGV